MATAASHVDPAIATLPNLQAVPPALLRVPVKLLAHHLPPKQEQVLLQTLGPVQCQAVSEDRHLPLQQGAHLLL